MKKQRPDGTDGQRGRSAHAWDDAFAIYGKTKKVKIPTTGYHTLKVWMVDPGITVQKILIDLGKLQPSYLGPPQSYNKPAGL